MASARSMEVHHFVQYSPVKEVRRPAPLLRGVFDTWTVEGLLSSENVVEKEIDVYWGCWGDWSWFSEW